jgi:hypothetical protein
MDVTLSVPFHKMLGICLVAGQLLISGETPVCMELLTGLGEHLF